MARTILLVQPDAGARGVPAGIALASHDVLEEVASSEEALDRLGDADHGVEALILPPELEEPLDVAQRAHALDRDLAIIILAEPDHCVQVARALQFAPFLGEDVTCVATTEQENLALEIGEAVGRARLRRDLRAAAEDAALAAPTPPQAEQYLGQLLHHAPIGVVVVDEAGAVLGWNRRAGELLGARERRVLGTPLTRLFPDEEGEKLSDVIAGTVPGGPFAEPKVFQRTDATGNPQFVEVTAAALTGRAGEPGVMVLLRDVTDTVLAEDERRWMEEALRFQKTLLESQSEASMEGMLVVSREARILSFNRRFGELWGIADEVPGLRSGHAARVAIEQQLAEPSDFLARLGGLSDDPDETSRSEIVLRDGRTFETYSAPVKNAESAHYGRVWFFRDTTDLKRAQELVQSRAHQQAAVARLGQRALQAGVGGLMEEAAALLADTLGVEYAAVLELLPDGGELLLRAGVGWREGLVASATVEAGVESQAGYTLVSKSPVIVEDLTTETRFSGPRLLRDHAVASGMSTVIGGRAPAFGVLGVHTTRRRTFTGDDVNFLRAVANVLGAAIERADADEERVRLFELERAARAEAERANTILAQVEAVTEAALGHFVLDHLLDELLARICSVMEAETAAILLTDEERDELVTRAAVGLEKDVDRGFRIPVGTGFAGRIAAERRAVFTHDLDAAEVVSPLLRAQRVRALLGVPLLVEGRVTGVLHIGTLEPRSFTDEDARLLQVVGDRVALAIEQSRLLAAERDARNAAQLARARLEFLAEASAVLSSSLEYESTLASLAQLAVSRLADWCVVHVLEDGTLRQLAVAHADPGNSALVEKANRRYPFDPDRPSVVKQVVTTGESVLLPEIPDSLIEDAAHDEEHLECLRNLGFVSAMIVRLAVHDRTIGAITLVSSHSGRVYSTADLSLAEELARRAALAVENARLYQEAEERAHAARVLAAVADGVFLLDRRGVVRLWNPAAQAITGLPAERVLGRPAEEAIPGWSEIVDRLPVAESPGPHGSRPETVPLEIDGRELWLSFSGVGFSEGTVYAFRDLTEERRLDELKTDFVATASHELRTPLAAVYGAAMTLRRADLPLDIERRDLLLSVIADESDRLARIVNDILWVSRLESGEVEVDIEALDARECARRVIEAAEVHLTAGVGLALVAPIDLPLVDADEQKLTQVLTNLLDNAIKYSPHGGRVELRLAPRDHYLRLAVRDEGLGIPTHEQARIFEKFYRLDPQLTRGVGGTGLGLYIVRELVRRMNGRIWVSSREGKGSTFFVELPLAESGPLPQPDPDASQL